MRRTSLVFALLILLSGCVAGPLGGPNSDSTIRSPSCELASVPLTDAPNETREYPELPATFNRSTTLLYVLSFEEAYAWHRSRPGEDKVYVYTRKATVDATDEGYVVRIESVEVSTYDGKDVGSGAWSAFYLITESTVLRGEGHAGAPAEAPPRSEWQVVCG